ncbi:MAG: hypothetical protein O9301_01680 [Leptospira sp.]|nr:hypothetical protein [Leptospira sp.]
MSLGFQRFSFYLNKLEVLLETASESNNPGLTFYSNDGRTPLFMLEGLSRLYSEFQNSSKFTSLKERFKLFEDLLGSIDYFDVYSKHYEGKSEIPNSIKEYMSEQKSNSLLKLNQNLNEVGWIGKNKSRFKEELKILNKIEWLKPKEEVKEIKKLYEKEISSIHKFIRTYGNPFSEMEDHVHELRRDIRWLSIFTQALQGAIQFGLRTGSTERFESYLTPAVLNSKFNQLPEIRNNTHAVLLERNAFLALSWLIAEIGNIKDEGLEYFALQEAYIHIEGLNQEEAGKKANQILNWKEGKISELLVRASNHANEFIKKNVLGDLVLGIVKFS